MSDDVAIKVNKVSKNFRVPHEKHNSLKDKAVHIFGPRNYTKFQALEDINFEVKKGEFFGIVGKNGSGKSTLLKILANIYQPTKGNVEINGSLAPFIELGVGFNPELTGRENVFLSGAILGLSRKKIAQIYDEIVDFAELEEFMDQKLKNYSSGMQVRLAFSIAVRAESDILLIDEVLAVGDSAFQIKCLNYFEQLKKQKKTVVFVSHDMEAIKQFCDKTILIHQSNIAKQGRPEKIVAEYYKINSQLQRKKTSNVGSGNFLKTINTTIKETKPYIQELGIEISWKEHSDIKNIGVSIFRSDGLYFFGTKTIIDQHELKTNSIKLSIKNLNINSGVYYLSLGFFGESDREIIDYIDKADNFSITNISPYNGLLTMDTEWK